MLENAKNIRFKKKLLKYNILISGGGGGGGVDFPADFSAGRTTPVPRFWAHDAKNNLSAPNRE